MKQRGYWSDVKLSDIKIKDTSGDGGSRTIKMSAKGAVPEAVGFHLRKGSVLEGFADELTKFGARLFEEHDLGPK